MWPSRLAWSAYLAYHLRGQARFPFQSPQAIARVRDRRVRQMVLHAFRTVPYYRELLPRLGLSPADFRTADDLARLPILEREDVQANPHAFFSTAHPADRCLGMSTGGSTGKPVVVLWDAASILQNAAHAERERSMLTKLIGRSFGYRELNLGALTGIGNIVRRFTATHALLPPGLQIQRRYHSLLDPPEAAVRLINAFRPHVIQGYGSYVALIFAELERTNAPFHRPKAISFNSDSLPDSARSLIEGRFGIPVFSTYQAAEAFKIGFECEAHAGLHLNDDLYPLRLVDADGRAVPHGVVGDVVVSNLVNRATVFLNYRIGDRGVAAADPCACGRSLPMTAYLEGRSGEPIAHANGRGFSAQALDSEFWSELKNTLLYQVDLSAPGQVTWRIVPRADVDRDALSAAVLAKCHAIFGGNMTPRVEFVQDVARTAGGKVRQAIPSSSDLAAHQPSLHNGRR
jgi:phenylacetate-CoA ligase